MSNAESRNPFTRRGFIIAAVGVGVVVLAAIVVLIAMLTRTPDPAPTPTAPGTPTPTETADPADASVCGLPGFEEESSLTSVPDTEWELVGTVAAPTDPDGAGPGVIDDDGFRSCYAHTAEGALYAAINYVAMTSDANLRGRMAEAAAPGPGRDAAASNNEQSSATNLRAQVAGFDVEYAEDRATVDVVYNLATGQLVSLPLQLEWAEGDWKIVVTDVGQIPLEPAQIPNLGGYIPWSGA